MAKVSESIEVNASINDCYEQWMQFEKFPRFMDHVKSVTKTENNLWHWIVDGPMGAKLEWDAEMKGAEAERSITWRTVSDSAVKAAGAVLFEEVSLNLTKVTSNLDYEAPGGVIGEAVANIFSNPGVMVKQDLTKFKALLEEKSLVTAQ